MPEVPVEVKRFIRSVLLSKVGGIKVERFQQDYKNLIGQPLRYLALGYSSLIQLIDSIPDVARIKTDKYGSKTIFGIMDPQIRNHTAKKAQFIPDESVEVMEERKSEWSDQLFPNLRGLYCVFIPKSRDMSREKVNHLFSEYGNVVESSFTPRYVFVRYQHKFEALDAIEDLRRKNYDVKVPVEKDDPRKVIKQKDVSGELPAYPKIVAKRSGVADAAGEQEQLEVFMGNLPLDITEADITLLVKEFQVLNIRVKGNDTKRFAFLLVPNKEVADNITSSLHRTNLGGRTLVVQTSYTNMEKRPGIEDKVILDSMKKGGIPGKKSFGYRLADSSNEICEDELVLERGSSQTRPILGLKDQYRHHNNHGSYDQPPGLELVPSSDQPKRDSYSRDSNQNEFLGDKVPGLEKMTFSHPLHKQFHNEGPPDLERVTGQSNSQRQQIKDRQHPHWESSYGSERKGPPELENVNMSKTHGDQRHHFQRNASHKSPDQKFQRRDKPSSSSNGPPGLEQASPIRNEPYSQMYGYHQHNNRYDRSPKADLRSEFAERVGKGHENEEHQRRHAYVQQGDQNEDRFDLYVGGFPFHTSEENLMEIFEPYGASYVKMKNNEPPSKTYCFVVFENYEDASDAFANLDKAEYNGRHLLVNFGRQSIVDENDLVKKLGNFKCTINVSQGGGDEQRLIALEERTSKKSKDGIHLSSSSQRKSKLEECKLKWKNIQATYMQITSRRRRRLIKTSIDDKDIKDIKLNKEIHLMAPSKAQTESEIYDRLKDEVDQLVEYSCNYGDAPGDENDLYFESCCKRIRKFPVSMQSFIKFKIEELFHNADKANYIPYVSQPYEPVQVTEQMGQVSSSSTMPMDNKRIIKPASK